MQTAFRHIAGQRRPQGPAVLAAPSKVVCRVLPGAESVLAALLGSSPVAFLPWKGCDQGGSYSTGIKGAPGKDCQLIYQPAASAEARAIAKLEQAQQVPAPDPAPSAPASVTAQRLTDLQSAEVLSEEAKGWLRDELDVESQARARVLSDAMWQSLE